MKNIIKKFSICFLLILINFVVYANTKQEYSATYSKGKLELAKITYKDEIEKISDEICYYNFIKKSIPEKFVDPFYEYTKDEKMLGIELLGIAKHESGWKCFVGPKNSNGTRDYGPLMLNSSNVEDEEFMKAFASNCEKYKYDRDIYYLCICINFYKSLRYEFGGFNALQIYNGGWRTIRKNCPRSLKNVVINYANRVYEYINNYECLYKEYKDENLNTIFNNTAIEFSERICFYISRIDESNNNLYIKYIKTTNNENCKSNHNIEHIFFFDEKFYKTFILNDWIPINYIISNDNKVIVLDKDEEYFMLC